MQLYIARAESDNGGFVRLFTIWIVLALTNFYHRQLYAKIISRKSRSFRERNGSKFSGSTITNFVDRTEMLVTYNEESDHYLKTVITVNFIFVIAEIFECWSLTIL